MLHLKKGPIELSLIISLGLVLAMAVRAGEAPKVSPLTPTQLENMAYKVEDATGGVALLHNGKFEDRPAEPGAATHLEVNLIGPMAHGDLNGDGAPDAAVLVARNPGGSGTFIELAVVLNENGTPRHAASVSLGDRVKVLRLSIQDQAVTVEMLTQGPNDAMSEPTKWEKHSYLLTDGKLTENKGA